MKDFEIQVLANQVVIMTSISRILRELLPQSETVDTLCREIYGGTTASIKKICDEME